MRPFQRSSHAIPMIKPHVFRNILAVIAVTVRRIDMSAVIWGENDRMMPSSPCCLRGFGKGDKTSDMVRDGLQAFAGKGFRLVEQIVVFLLIHDDQVVAIFSD